MFKKLKGLFFYIRTIKRNINRLKEHFILSPIPRPYTLTDIKIDNAYRIYTVMNFKPKTQEEMRNYGYYYMDNEVKKFIKEFSVELTKIGLMEYVGLAQADQINEYSVLIVMEYKNIRTTKLFKRLIYTTIISLVIGTLFYFDIL